MKLNLGCGSRVFDGYVNIDVDPENTLADEIKDVKDVDYPDNSVEEIIAIHLFEHFYVWEVPGILTNWLRMLRPGGKLILEMPCLDKILENFQKPGVPASHTFLALYGNVAEKKEWMQHKWAYGYENIKKVLAQSGFTNAEVFPPKFKFQDRDMRVEAYKP